jgi:hypothetical protein
MDEINTTPSSSDGQGINTAPAEGGQAVTPNQENGQGVANDPQAYTRKIAEMGFQNTQLKQQLDQLQRQNQEYGQKINKFEPVFNALGTVYQPQQKVDPVDSLLENPNAFIASAIKNNPELLREILNEVPEIQELKQSESTRQVGEFIQSQNNILFNELNKLETSGAFSKDQIGELAKLPNLMQKVGNMTDPKTGQRLNANQQRLQVANEIQQAGGIEALLHREIGAMYAKDPVGFARTGALNLNQLAYKAKRASAFTGNSAGESGVSNLPSSSTTRVYR